MEKYFAYLYHAFTFIGVLGISTRLVYTFNYGEYPQRDLLKNTFTRIKLIDANMMTIPLVFETLILIIFICLKSKVTQNQLIQSGQHKDS